MLQIYTFSRKSKDFFCISLSFNLLKHHKDPIPTLSFLRYYQHMALIAQSGGKNIGFATILQLQSLAQFCHGKWEIAGGDVRFRNAGELAFQFLFIKGGNGDDAERPAWKCFDRLLTYEEMTVLGKHLDRKSVV